MQTVLTKSQLHTPDELRRALEREEFALHYQPLVDLTSGELQGFEAMLRWMHPKRGVLYAAEFLPAVEESDLIVPLTQWTLDQMGQQIGRWQASLGETIHLITSMNISVQYLARGNITKDIQAVASKSQIDYHCLRLEFTETQIAANRELLVHRLREVSDAGMRVFVDDFGGRCLPIWNFYDIPVCGLKIDRSVTRTLHTPRVKESLAAMLSLANALGLDVIAKGVEKERQLEDLRTIGCQYGQGFYFSPALDADAAYMMLAEAIIPKRGGKVDASRLRTFELFGNLSDADLEEIAQNCSELDVPTDHVVIRQGQVGNRFYLLESGSVAAYRGTGDIVQLLATLSAPSVFGEMAIVNPERIRTANVKALLPLHVLVIPIPKFVPLLRSLPLLESNFRRLLAERSAQ